ncbi:MAG: peptidase U32 family protein [Ignavibacteriales bacterium]
MSKIIIIPSDNNLNNDCDGYIIGVKSLSVNMPIYFELNELIDFINKIKGNKQEVFISLNKNMHNGDLKYLEEVMQSLNGLGINGVLYYDISVVNIWKRLNVDYELVWAQEHLTTNYLTCNYWYDKGVRYTYLSSEITTNEIQEIRKNTKMKLMVPIFGYLPMFVSKRHVVKNYLNYFDLKDNSDINYIAKESKVYPIVDNENGTTVYSCSILNGIGETLKLTDIEYLVLNGFNIGNNFNKVVKMFKNVDENNIEEYINELDQLFNSNRGFLHSRTIYKVKNNE